MMQLSVTDHGRGPDPPLTASLCKEAQPLSKDQIEASAPTEDAILNLVLIPAGVLSDSDRSESRPGRPPLIQRLHQYLSHRRRRGSG